MVHIGKKNAEALRKILQEVRDAATLENSAFSDGLKKEVRLHHQTWIISPTVRIISFLDAAIDNKKCICLDCGLVRFCPVHGAYKEGA